MRYSSVQGLTQLFNQGLDGVVAQASAGLPWIRIARLDILTVC